MARKLARGVFYLSLLVTAGTITSFFIWKSPIPFAGAAPNALYAQDAMFWKRLDLGVKCRLCPFNCYLPEGSKGRCRVRMCRNGTLYTQVYGQPVAMAVDPIEKKPVFHMLPGSPILSLSTVGCPLRCGFCQNWSISQAYPEKARRSRRLSPEEIVKIALENRIPSIAYTYGEPAVFYEYMYETARRAKRRGLRNVMVTSV
jgi:pyruvate formate lyase activating enzyme